MWISYAGNRTDSADAEVPRFPDEHVEGMRRRVRRLLRELRLDGVAGSAAAGSDLLILSEALAAGIPSHVILPAPVEQFRAASVADRGDTWTAMYDRIISELPPDHLHVPSAESVLDEAAFREANGAILSLAETLASGSLVLALAIRPRQEPGRASVTDDFVDRADGRGYHTIDLDPSLDPARLRRAFVAMPYGTKDDFAKRRKIDCESVFSRLLVPALEDADLEWERADRQVDSGIIHVGMIEALANADVVVVDTATLNPNVFYELGLRHAFADKTTVIIGPSDQPPPFDIAPVRHVQYDLDGPRIDELPAFRAMQQLAEHLDRPKLERAGPDSPVHSLFETDRVRLPLKDALSDEQEHAITLHRRLSGGRALSREELLDIARDTESVGLDATEHRGLLLKVGMALLAQLEVEDAVRVLAGLEFDLDDAGYPLWVQQTSLAISWLGNREQRRGGDPEPHWKRAEDMVVAALANLPDDPETCGIAGGRAKRRFRLLLERGDRERSRVPLERSIGLYERGFQADPTNFYVGFNLVALLRIRGQHFPSDSESLQQVRDLAPLVRFFAQRALSHDSSDFWAAVTIADLAAVESLMTDEVISAEVLEAYARALAIPHDPRDEESIDDQLRLYEVVGDSVEELSRVSQLLERPAV